MQIEIMTNKRRSVTFFTKKQVVTRTLRVSALLDGIRTRLTVRRRSQRRHEALLFHRVPMGRCREIARPSFEPLYRQGSVRCLLWHSLHPLL
jgi:hypothetical protein